MEHFETMIDVAREWAMLLMFWFHECVAEGVVIPAITSAISFQWHRHWLMLEYGCEDGQKPC